jgi:hypothetical protein
MAWLDWRMIQNSEISPMKIRDTASQFRTGLRLTIDFTLSSAYLLLYIQQ